MSLFERMERKLERTVNGVFAKAFRSEVQPLELAAAVRRAMDDRATLLGRGRTIVPNLFTIELSQGDYDRLTEYDEELEAELIAAAEEHAETQRYQPGGPLQVLFDADESLETGVFRVRPATARTTVQRADQADDYDEPGEDYDEYSGSLPVQSTGEDPDEAWGDADYADDDYADEDYADDAVQTSGAAEQTVPRRSVTPPPPPIPATAAPGRVEAETRTHEPARREPTPRRVSVHDRPWLEVDGERYPLLGPMTVLGRDDSADIILDDPGISRRHCEVRVTADGPRYSATLRDLASTNGTYVNGEQHDATRLADGDRITVGRTTVHYRTGRR